MTLPFQPRKLWSPIVGQLTPYVPGEQPSSDQPLIKLNTNECPYPPSPKVIEAIKNKADSGLRLYPDPTAAHLRCVLAHHHQLTTEHVFTGNGSDEVLAIIFQALLHHSQPLLMPDITYSFYPVYCKLYGIEVKKIALDEKFEINISDYDQPAGGIIIANPNAPTGIALPLEKISQLANLHPHCCIVIDEAYVDFGAQSAASLLDKHPNLVIVRTFSKSYALSGLRVGYALAHPELIEALMRIKDSINSYPLDRLAQTGACAAIEDQDWFKKHTQKIIDSRTTLTASLKQLGFMVLPSQANFIFVSHATIQADKLTQALRAKNIIIRYFNTRRISNFMRITIGTEDECTQLVKALKDILM